MTDRGCRGAYRINSGERLRLDGSDSREGDENGGIIRWIWDLDGDGMFDGAEGDRLDIGWEELVNGLGLFWFDRFNASD